MKEIKELDDIFHNCGCLLDSCNDFEEFQELYKLALQFAIKEDRTDELLQWRLEELTGYCGSNNQDFSDFIAVIRMVKDDEDKRDQERDKDKSLRGIIDFAFTNRLPFGVEDVAERLNLPENYVNLIYCVLCSCDAMTYGTSLQFAWLKKLGRELIELELGEEFAKFYEEKYFQK